MLKRDVENNRVIFILAVLFGLIFINPISAQPNVFLDTLENVKEYNYPIPRELDWRHDVYAARNFLVDRSIEDGFWKQYFSTDNDSILSEDLARIFQVKMGKLNGKTICFRQDQSLSRVEYYINGNLNAKSYFYSLEQIKDSVHYNLESGMDFRCSWHENGNIKYRGDISKQSYWYENGKIKLIKKYRNGKLDGEVIYQDEKDEYIFNFLEGKRNKYGSKTVDSKKFKYRKLDKDIKKIIEYNCFN